MKGSKGRQQKRNTKVVIGRRIYTYKGERGSIIIVEHEVINGVAWSCKPKSKLRCETKRVHIFAVEAFWVDKTPPFYVFACHYLASGISHASFFYIHLHASLFKNMYSIVA